VAQTIGLCRLRQCPNRQAAKNDGFPTVMNWRLRHPSLRGRRLAAAVLLCAALGLCDQPKPRRAEVITEPIPLSSISNLSAVPGTIGFNSSDPDTGPVAGGTPATVSWTVHQGNNNQNWTLSVQSGSASFTGCGTVPVSAVTVACTSAVVGGGGTGACNPPFSLSTSPQQVAGGKESGPGNRSYVVTLTFTFSDSWRYVAARNPACTLTLTYTADVP
jgi:hypothetical protein